MPSKRKKSSNKRTKAKSATAKRPKKALRAKRAAKPSRAKKVVTKKQSKKRATKARSARNRVAPVKGDRRLESAAGIQYPVSSRQSGDLQGLSRTVEADSESVEELVEEGNLFEAGAVAGVEEADNADEREVHTRELPENDVPEEYLDKD